MGQLGRTVVYEANGENMVPFKVNAWVFMAGFMTNAITWRLQQHAMDDIGYPIVLLVLSILAIIVQPKVK